MKPKNILPFLICYLAILGVFGCKNGTSSKAKSYEIPTGEISVNDFDQKLDATTNAQLIDVRTPEEFESGHLLNAINIDWNGTDFDLKVKALDKSKPTFVYCLSGGRSHEAAMQMKSLGYTEIYEMQGGMRAWNKAGKALVTADKNEDLKGITIASYTKLITSEKLVLVDFNAPWCGPCKRMSPILEEISKEQQKELTLLKINSDENAELSTTLKVEDLPTLILYKKGKEAWKHVGYIDKIELMVAIESVKKQKN